MKTLLVTSLLLILLSGTALFADDTIEIGDLDGINPSAASESYSVRLALSGGGARGLSSIGVLKAFEEKGITITAITGTSMGSIVGGLYACGYTPTELNDLVDRIEFTDLFSNAPARSSMFLTQRQARERHLVTVRFDGVKPYIPRGLTAGQKLTSLLTQLTVKANYLGGGDFLQLPIPFRTVCTDIVHGGTVVLDKGSLADAMRASMAFPLAFTGLETGDSILMDGGMVAPVPVSILQSMGDTTVPIIAVNTTSPLLPKNELVTPVDIANQVTSIMTDDRLHRELSQADYVITPQIDQYSSMDFKKKQEIINLGYQAGLTAADSIITMIKRRHDTTRYYVSELTISNSTRVRHHTVEDDLLHGEFTRDALVDKLKQISRADSLFSLDASVRPCSAPADAGTNAKFVSLAVDLHPTFDRRRSTVKFVGNHVFDDSALLKVCDFEGDRITPDDLKQAKSHIADLYARNGYDLAQVRDIKYDFDNQVITILIDEAVIRRIDIANNEVTRDWLVRSYFPLSVGEPYSTEKASQGIANIYGTDLFERVGIDLVPYDSGAVIVLGVTEKKYSQARFGWHWDDAYQSEEFLELLNDNVLGIGAEYLVHARYGTDRQHYYTQLRANRIFSTYLTARLRVFYSNLDRSLFAGEESLIGVRNEQSWGVSMLAGQQIARLGTVTGGLKLEEIRYENEVDHTKEQFGLRSIILESLVENFDQPNFPNTGNKHLLQLQFAGKYLGGEVEFAKYFSSFETYLPFGRYLNYHPKLSIGISRKGLPPSEQFYIGGLHSFSGFRTYQLVGDKVFLFNQELRVKLPLRLYFYGRYDIGEVYQSADQIKLRNLRHGVGLSLAFDSPIGPFEFGYGIADSDVDRFYFSAGFEF